MAVSDGIMLKAIKMFLITKCNQIMFYIHVDFESPKWGTVLSNIHCLSKKIHFVGQPFCFDYGAHLLVALFGQPYATSQHLFPSRIAINFWPRFCIDDRSVKPFLQSFPTHPKDF